MWSSISVTRRHIYSFCTSITSSPFVIIISLFCRSNNTLLPRKCWHCLDIAHRLEFVRIMMQRLQCNVFMLSYRGYGESDGHPSQHGIIMDSQVSSLILENTFTSILDMAGIMFPFLRWFISGSGSKGPKILNCIVRSPWRTIDIIGKIKRPILFLSGLQDELVPPSHMQMLYSKTVENNWDCRFVEFPNGMHMDTWFSGGDRYWRTIQLFLDQYVPEIKDGNLNFQVDDDKGNPSD
ncbi:Prolyl oligopeptidase family [Musa troglodytarum]|uniref:Prolyl oligopeptidase family n=1 Tax=Musa troglodytarum TaxID=320322 RepID=A0A9E7ERH2_9LILI|nr:Prolyl oligopeptidase family [Musa troglodytarum]